MILGELLRKTNLFSNKFRKQEEHFDFLRYVEEKREAEEAERYQALWHNLIAPEPKNNPWNKVRMGKLADGNELVVDLAVTPNIFLQGQPGSGKTVAQHVVLNHCLSHMDQWEVIVIDLAHFREYNSLDTPANTRLLKMVQTKVDAITTIKRLFGLLQARTQMTVNTSEHIMVSIDNFEYMMQEIVDERNNRSNFSHEFVSADEGKEVLLQLDMLIQLGSDYGIHFCIESNQEGIPLSISKSMEKGHTTHLGFGRAFVGKKILGWNRTTPVGFGVELNAESKEPKYFKGYISASHLKEINDEPIHVTK